jgi:hypothetical protein
MFRESAVIMRTASVAAAAVQPLVSTETSVVPFSLPNPFFPSQGLCSAASGSAAAATSQPIVDTCSTVTSTCPRECEEDLQDDSSLDSILLEDGPNPVKPATPGRPARTFFRAISASEGIDSPVAAAAERQAVPLAASPVLASSENAGLAKQAQPDQDSASDVCLRPHCDVCYPS